MEGRFNVTGTLDSCNAIRVSDAYSDNGPAVEVEPFWCNESECMKIKIRCFACPGDDVPSLELVWDQLVLTRDGSVIAR